MFKTVLYVQIRPDQFSVRKVGEPRMVDRVASEPFSHPRTVIGSFTTAQAELKALVAETRGGFSLKLDILIHPLERIEGGLTQIEERALLELALGAGASHARVWVGAPLTDQEVIEKLKA